MNKYKLTLFLMAICLLFIGFSLNQNSADASFNFKDDKALERVFKIASEAAKAEMSSRKGRGCETIPYSDLQSDCNEQSKLREKYCKDGVLLSCKPLKNPLNQAEAKKDKRKITEIRDTGLDRVETANSCIEARIETQLIFKRALGRVERDKSLFAGKRSSAKNIEMKDFYTNMIEYCDNILAYYNKEKDGHTDQVSQVRTIINDCKIDIVDKADAALKKLPK
ncbi:MAG: hypothetical protein MUC29_05265 [Pyrinomonadaceae bacterium]|nr:hypothetical protein [Pyrinomonadaceae bacterium]